MRIIYNVNHGYDLVMIITVDILFYKETTVILSILSGYLGICSILDMTVLQYVLLLMGPATHVHEFLQGTYQALD